jgi:threonine synthase
VGAEPAGAASLAGLQGALNTAWRTGWRRRSCLVTCREVKAGGGPSGLHRVGVVDKLGDVEAALAGETDVFAWAAESQTRGHLSCP